MHPPAHTPLPPPLLTEPYHLPRLELSHQLAAAQRFYDSMRQRRTCRHFSAEPVDPAIITWALRTAATAPSGANMQPWHFSVVQDPDVKRQIRTAAEAEEHTSYHGRMPRAWLEDLAPLGTDEHKPFLEIAPYLIVVFAQSYRVMPDGEHRKNYYVQESVGLATGLLLAALHQAGLATLTHTPSPMDFLRRLLNRPDNERPFVLIPVGYPAPDCQVPTITKKPLDEVCSWL